MTKAERERTALRYRCPECKAQEYFRCVRSKGIRPARLAHPHAGRTALVTETEEKAS